MSFPPPITGLKLNVSVGTSPNVQTFEQDVPPSSLSGTTNSVLITNSDLLNAFDSQPLGTTFTPSIVTTYEGFPSGNSLSTESSSPFVPRQITTNLSFQTIPDLNALTAPFELIVSTNSPAARAPLSFSSSNPSVLSVSSSGLVTAQGSGTVTITASQEVSSDNVYTAATFVSRVITVVKEILTLSNFTIPAKNFGNAPFTLSAPTSDSSGAFTYTSSDESVATVNSTTGLVTIIGGGSSTITVTQAATNNYTSATTTASLVVSPIAHTISNFTVPAKNFGDAPFTLSAPTTNSGGAFTYTSSDESVATISGSTVTIVGRGETVITATQAATNNYTSATITDSLFVITGWTQRGLDIDGEAEGDFSGRCVAISSDGNTVAIGAIGNDGNNGGHANAGHVRVYNWNGTLWVKRGLDIDGEAGTDESGYSVSLSSDGNTVAIGAPYNNGAGAGADSGHVRVYDWNTSITPNGWTQRGLDIDGEAAYDQSGWSVSLSSDGNTVAIGAIGNDGNNGGHANAGHVRVYDWTESSWTQRGQDIDGVGEYDRSGYSVSLSSDGNTVSIGAPYNNGTGSDAGHVRVYNWNGASWAKRGTDIDGEAALDSSGYSVSLSSDGNTVAIGAPYNYGASSYAGHVRVYHWNGTLWVKRGLDIDGEAAYDQSGYSVSLSSDGNTVAIGALTNSEARIYAGHVRIFNWNGISWNQVGLDIDGEFAYDYSGWSVSLSSDGNTLAIGAPYNDGTGSNAGHVRVYKVVKEIPTLSNFNVPPKNFGDAPFTLSAPTSDSDGTFSYTSSDESVATISGSTVTIVGDGTTIITATQAATNNYTSATTTASLVVARWTQRGSDIDGEAANDCSGYSVSLSSDGNTVAIGAPDNNNAGSDAGHVRVYDWTESSWTQRGQDIDGEAANDYSGQSVSLSSDGNTVAIGAPYNYGASLYAGHVRVYDWNGSSWAKRGSDINGEAAYDYSGRSVSLSSDGNTVAIGAYGNSAYAGHVRVYDWNGSSWAKRGSDIDGEAEGDFSGYSVSLSSDGNTVAIGADGNDGAGLYAGHVRVYDWNGVSVSWAKRGLDIDGEAAYNQSGYSVSLSSDGNTVAIGAYGNSDAGVYAGNVRVYDWNGSSWAKRGSDIDGEAPHDYSGYSVSLSSDGNTVAIGAPYNDGAGSNAGQLRVYDWNAVSVSWAKRGLDIDGEAAGDLSGYSVSLSSDGNTVAIGAPNNDNGSGSNAGHVRVYTWQ